MPRPLLPAAAVAAAAALVVLAGGPPAQAVAPVDPDVVVTASAGHHLAMPTQIPAGVVRFRVRGPADENLQLAQARGTAGPQQLVDDGNALNAHGSATALEHDFVAVGGTSTGSSVWLRLAPGTYYAIDTGAEKATVDMVVTIQVTGDASRGAMPEAGATIAAVHEMDWAKRPTRIPASGVLRFADRSTEYHFIELAKLKHASTTLAQVKKALKKHEDSLIDPRGDYSTGVLAPGLSQDSTYRLPRGTYVLACFWPDEHGVPHALMGMVRLIRVG